MDITIEKPKKCKSDIVQDKSAAIDLGQIHLGAVVTETGESVIVSGREIRSLKRQQNMVIAKMQKRISKCKKASKLFKKLVRSKKRFLASMRRRIRDVRHKATRQIIEFCKENNVTKISVGDPSGVKKKKCGRKHNQRMSQWEFGKDIQYISSLPRRATRLIRVEMPRKKTLGMTRREQIPVVQDGRPAMDYSE